MKYQTKTQKSESGFSLLELLIAMVVTVVIAGAACTLLATSLNVRTRSNEKTDALADAERALNIMSREIGNAGFNMTDNGIVPQDSVIDANGNSTIRIRANLNKFSLCECPSCPCASQPARDGIGVIGEDAGEDVKYFLYPTAETNLLARYDQYSVPGGNSTVLANRLDSLRIHYFDQKVTYSTSGCDITGASLAEVSVASAKYIVIAVCVNQPAVGAPDSPGYQPATNVLLVSDVALRNANLVAY